MESQKPTLTQFIESYAQHSANRNFPALVAQFAESFLVAGPGGAQCVRAEDFAKALPRRAEWFQSLGAQPADLVNISATWMDERYALVHTTWRFTFLREQGTTERIDSYFLPISSPCLL